MAAETGIAWTTSTFNPWIGCTKVGPGCDHCYAEARMDKRLHIVNWGTGSPRKRTSIANWRGPVKWNAERARAIAAGENPAAHYVFCSSLADVFDNEVDPQWRADLFALIRATPHLTWQLLTKRIGNASKMLAETMVLQDDVFAATNAWPWPNVWLGATVVNQEEADRDIPKLLAVPAAKRFLSVEPMLGPITLPGFDAWSSYCPICKAIVPDSLSAPHESAHGAAMQLTSFNPNVHCSAAYDMIHWVIAGGESGPQARPAHPDWFRSLRDQCAAAGVPFLFKQWGEWTPGENVQRVRGVVDTAFLFDDEWSIYPLNLATDEGHIDDQPDLYRVGTKAAGNHLDGRQHFEFPA